jgi:hypothetical protein
VNLQQAADAVSDTHVTLADLLQRNKSQQNGLH